MAYKKQTWKDEILASPERYRIEQDGRITHPSASIELITDVKQAASPVNAARMNHIEDGIGQHDADIAATKSIVTYNYNDLNKQILGLRLDTSIHDESWSDIKLDGTFLRAFISSNCRALYRKIGRMIEFQINWYGFDYTGPMIIDDREIATIPESIYAPMMIHYFPVAMERSTGTGGVSVPMLASAYVRIGGTGKIYFFFKSDESAASGGSTAIINVTGSYPCDPKLAYSGI